VYITVHSIVSGAEVLSWGMLVGVSVCVWEWVVEGVSGIVNCVDGTRIGCTPRILVFLA